MSDILLEIRPSMGEYRKFVKTTPIIWLSIVVFCILRGVFLGGALFVILVGIGAAWGVLYMRRAHIAVTRDELIRYGIFRRRHWRRVEIKRLIDVPMSISATDARVFGNLFVLDSRGRKILRLRDTHWRRVDLTRLVEVLALPVSRHGEPLAAKKFHERYPNILPFPERRPWLTATLLVAVVVIAVAIWYSEVLPW